MHAALWVVQVVLALVFLASGVMKVTRPKEQLADQMRWVEDFSDGQVKLIGAVEILAAIGLVVPGLTGIMPVLTPLAAAGLVMLMIGAVVTHVRRGEQTIALVNVVLLVLAAIVVWGRFWAAAL